MVCKKNELLEGKELMNGRLSHEKKQQLRPGLILFLMYIFFSYTGDSQVIPSVLTTVCLYGFILFTAFTIVSKKKIRFNLQNRWWLLFTGFCVVAFLMAGMKTSQALMKIVIILALSVGMSYVIESWKDVLLLVRMYVVAAAVLIVLLLATGQLFVSGRLGSALIGNANSFANALLFPAVLSIWLLIFDKGPVKRYIYLASLLFTVLAIGLSGGRKIILIVGACAVLLYLMNGRGNMGKTLRNIIIVAVLLGAAIYAMLSIPVLYNSIGVRFFDPSERVLQSDQTRWIYVQMGLGQWLQRPFLGHGLDTFKYYNQQVTGAFHYAHNNYVEMLYDFGLVGFILYYAFPLKCLRRLWRMPSSMNAWRALGLSLVAAVFLFDLGGISYYTNTNQIMLLMAYLITVIPAHRTQLSR